MFSSIFFICWRLTELTTLIVPVGILSWFVDGFVKANQLTPTYILVLFIVVVLAAVWCLDTLIRHSTTKRSALFVCFVDLCFFGALIAGVYQLRDIATSSCSNFQNDPFMASLGPFGYAGEQSGNPLADHPNQVCSLLKTSFAFGIMNIVFFFSSAFWAFMLHEHEERHVEKRRRSSSHSSRRGHSGSRHHHHRSSSGRRHDYHV